MGVAFIAQSRVSLSYANETVQNPRKSFPAALLTGCFSLEVSSAVGQGCGKAQGPVSPGRGRDFLLKICLPASQSHPHPSRALHLPTVFLFRSTWQPTPVLLPGKFQGWRSLVGYSPWGRRGSDTTERLHFRYFFSSLGEGNENQLQCSCLESPMAVGAWCAAVCGVAQRRIQLSN